MSERKPKFRVGQVVMRKDGPMKIENAHWLQQSLTGTLRPEWLYGGQGKEALESTLRPLTKREAGR